MRDGDTVGEEDSCWEDSGCCLSGVSIVGRVWHYREGAIVENR